MKKLLLLAILLLLLPLLASASPDEAKGIVTKVVDGDTIDVSLQQHNSLVATDNIRVRLADIDCPEMSTSQGTPAKEYTTKWLEGKLVYLDIDNNRRTDDYGRYVAVVYLANPDGSLNTTQNLNRMLLDSHNACVWDFKDNEFSPEDWYGGSIPPTVCFKTDTTTSDQPAQSLSQSLPSASSLLASSSDGPFVGSAKSDKYHYPSCSAAKKIKSSNLVTFSSSADARAHGYVPAEYAIHPSLIRKRASVHLSL